MNSKTGRELAPDSRFAFRIGVTLAALLAFKLFTFIPLPGLSTAALSAPDSVIGGGGLERVSVMALGIMPWISAAILAEIAALILPARATASFVRNGHADPFSPLVIAGALVFAALQAHGVALALEALARVVPEPGSMFRLGVIATLVAATALAILLAGIIARHGIGRGFWVLFGAVALGQVIADVVQMVDLVGRNVAPPAALPLMAVSIAAAMAAIALLLMTRRRLGTGTAESIAWPIFIGSAIAPWLILAAQAVSGANLYQVLMPHTPLGGLLIAVMILAVAMAYRRRHGSTSLALVDTVVLTSIVIGFGMLRQWWGIPMPGGGSLVVLATVAGVFILDATQQNAKASR